MSADDIIIDSANAAVNTVATDGFTKLTQQVMSLTSAELARHLRSDDAPGLLVPLDLEQDGKDRLGAILAVGDRAILAWTVGTFRVKYFSDVLPYEAIQSVEVGTRAAGAMTKERELLRVASGSRSYTLVFANLFEGGQSIVPFLAGVLDGSIKPVFE